MKEVYTILEKMGLSKPQEKFMDQLIYAILAVIGRINFRNLSRYMPYHEKTISRNFAKPFDFFKFNTLAIKEYVPVKGKLLAVSIDQVFVPKSGNKTFGRAKYWDGSSSRAHNGLELSISSLVDVNSRNAFPLLATQTPPKEELPLLTGKNDATRMTFYTDFLIPQLKDLNAEFGVKHVVADAFYSKKSFVFAVQQKGFHVVGKLRCDADLRSLDFEQNTGQGRPKKYGDKVDVKNIDSFDFACEYDDSTDLYTNDFYSINFKQVIRVVCAKYKTTMKLYFSTDLSLSPLEIYKIYKARFQQEFLHRDSKQYTGLIDCQARSKEKIHFHTNASLAALLFAKIQDLKKHAGSTDKVPFSMASHKIRNHNQMLLNLIFSNSDFDPSLEKIIPDFESVIEFGVIR